MTWLPIFWIFILHSTFHNICFSATDYCDISKNHTMCLYKNETPSPSCGVFHNIASQISNSSAHHFIVPFHNKKRSDVATEKEKNHHCPNAANMLEMRWSGELAFICSRRIKQCSYELPHKEVRDIELHGRRIKVGQNMYFFEDTNITNLVKRMSYGDILNIWYNEVKKMTENDFKGVERSDAVKNCTQMIWHDAELVGCSGNAWQHNERFFGHVCCNYASTLSDEPLYQKGDVCSLCPNGTECSIDYDGLCIRSEFKDKTSTVTPNPEKKKVKEGKSSAVSVFDVKRYLIVLLLIVVMC